ncbi:MAG TPA: oligosaccharide flippase family protein [Vulgatibacter sp.]|nr:oligosaccharide flippase family protein [Vulgatibacter sp.]
MRSTAIKAEADSSTVETLTTTDPGRDASPNPLTFRSSISWSFAGTFVYAACQWASLVVLAKLSSPETVGTLALATAATTPIFMLCNLQLRAIQATDAKGKYSFPTIAFLRLTTTSLALIGIGGYITLFSKERTLSLVIASIAISKALESFSDSIHGRLQLYNRQDLIAKSMATKGALNLALLSIAYSLTHNLAFSAGCLAVSSLIPLIAFDARALRRLHSETAKPPDQFRISPEFRPNELRSLLSSAIPLGITMMLVSLNLNVPRYAIEAFLDRHALGIYAALAQLIAVGSLVISSIGQAAAPRLARLHHAGNDRAFHRLYRSLQIFAVSLSAIGLLLSLAFGEWIVAFIFRPEYASHADLLGLLSVSGGLAYASSVTGYALTAAGVHRAQAPLYALVLLVGAASSITLTPIMGLHGVAVGLILSNSFQFACASIVLRRGLSSLHKIGVH